MVYITYVGGPSIHDLLFNIFEYPSQTCIKKALQGNFSCSAFFNMSTINGI